MRTETEPAETRQSEAQPAETPSHPAGPARRHVRARLGLAAALVAGGILLVVAPDAPQPQPQPADRTSVATAWPRAQRADIPGNLADGPAYIPGLFLDAGTSIGTASTQAGDHLRLVFSSADGSVRELRRLSTGVDPRFDNFTVDGDELFWMESTAQGRPRLWIVNLRDGSPARQLTADTGDAIFYGSQYDLVVADGRVYWAAGSTDDERDTQVRSVSRTGGAVDVRTERGTWALTAWPWLVNGAAEQSGATRLRNMITRQELPVNTTGVELTTCSPTWCRVMVMSGGDLVRIDLMRPDGGSRQPIAANAAAGGTAGNAATSAVTSAVSDVAPLDRFEILSEAGPNSDLTGTAALRVYDIAARRTIDVHVAASGVFYRAGVLWWSTGDLDTTVWHTIDLRTV